MNLRVVPMQSEAKQDGCRGENAGVFVPVPLRKKPVTTGEGDGDVVRTLRWRKDGDSGIAGEGDPADGKSGGEAYTAAGKLEGPDQECCQKTVNRHERVQQRGASERAGRHE